MTCRRVSYEQLEVMWEFLNCHKDVAVGFNKSAQARATCRRMWTELAEYLNSVVGGAIKDWKSWSNYWVDYKGRLKRKCAGIRASHSRTGGGPSTIPELTEVEQKFLSILGEDLGLGLPGIQVSVETELNCETSNEHVALMDPNLNSNPIIFTYEDQSPTQPNSNRTHPDTQPTQLDTHPTHTDTPTHPETHPTHIDTPTQPDTHPTHTDIQPTTAQRTQPIRRSSTPRRQRRRPNPMSQEAARRSLAESGRMRAEATVNMANAFQTYLPRIADTLDRIYQSLSGLPTNER